MTQEERDAVVGARRSAQKRATAPPGSKRPGGRTEKNRQAVAAAALELLGQGYTEMNSAVVARQAGVSVSTIYRRWPERSDLVREALTLHSRSLKVPDTGAFETDIQTLARSLSRFFSNPTEIAMSATMASYDDPGFAELQIEHAEEHLVGLSLPFERAIESGELSHEIDIPTLLDMLIGPMIMRTVVMRQRLTASYVRKLAEALIVAAKAVD
jgi:AcrR family transcriptional regulator